MSFYKKKMYTTHEYFVGADGSDKIFGIQYIPDRKGKSPLVIFSHELGCDHRTGADYAQALAEEGIAAYIYDFRNGGYSSRSGNDMSKMSVMTEAADLEKVLDEAKRWDFVDPGKIVLIGASQGGFVTSYVSSHHPDDAAGVVLLYPALLIQDDVHRTFPGGKETIPSTFSYKGWFTAGRLYAEDVWDYDVYKDMPRYKKPVLIIHGTGDGTVPCSYSERAAKTYPNARLCLIRGAGHGFWGRSFSKAMEEINRYLAEIGLLNAD